MMPSPTIAHTGDVSTVNRTCTEPSAPLSAALPLNEMR